jgi:hypothetical protein
MTSFAIRTIPSEGPKHVRVQVFAGPDEQHRALTGALVMTREQAEDFALSTGFPTARS